MADLSIESLDLTEIEAEAYAQLFDSLERDRAGFVPSSSLPDFLKQSGLLPPQLSLIWEMIGGRTSTGFDRLQIYICFRLVAHAQDGHELTSESKSTPASLPQFRRSTGSHPNLVTSASGSLTLQSWAISSDDAERYHQLFIDLSPTGAPISNEAARDFFLKSNLPVTVLSAVWQLADANKDGALDEREFYAAMHMVCNARAGRAVPTILPSELAHVIYNTSASPVPPAIPNALPILEPPADGKSPKSGSRRKTSLGRRNSLNSIDEQAELEKNDSTPSSAFHADFERAFPDGSCTPPRSRVSRGSLDHDIVLRSRTNSVGSSPVHQVTESHSSPHLPRHGSLPTESHLTASNINSMSPLDNRRTATHSSSATHTPLTTSSLASSSPAPPSLATAQEPLVRRRLTHGRSISVDYPNDRPDPAGKMLPPAPPLSALSRVPASSPAGPLSARQAAPKSAPIPASSPLPPPAQPRMVSPPVSVPTIVPRVSAGTSTPERSPPRLSPTAAEARSPSVTGTPAPVLPPRPARLDQAKIRSNSANGFLFVRANNGLKSDGTTSPAVGNEEMADVATTILELQIEVQHLSQELAAEKTARLALSQEVESLRLFIEGMGLGAVPGRRSSGAHE